MSSGECEGIIQHDEETHRFIWANIHQPIRLSTFVSPRFFTGIKKENVWYLRFRKESLRNGSFFCRLELFLEDSVLPHLDVAVEYFVSGRQSEMYDNRGYKQKIKKGEALHLSTMNPDEIRKAYEDADSRGGLRVCCIISHAYDKALSYSSKDVQVCEHSLMKDLGSLMSDTQLSDVDLTVKKQNFHAHKIILASRSPVFMAMFQNDMQEKSSNSIDIPDIDPDIMHKLLNYIYTDTVDNIEDSIGGLIAAAEKYQLEGLKSICSKVMINRLEEENVIETLVLADLYHVDDLRKESLKFIVQHIKNLKKLEAFDELCSSHPSLLKEILITVSDNAA